MMMTSMAEQIKYVSALKHHRGAITALACPTGDSSIKVLSASRDKTVVAWIGNEKRTQDDLDVAKPLRCLEGHSDFVQDVALSNTAEFALTASWDKSLRLWDLKTGATYGKFLGHSKDVLTCAFSPDNRLIVSGGRDGKLKAWNVKGQNVFNLDKDGHKDWVSCVRFSPNAQSPLFVSGGWDNVVKVWNLQECRCVHTLSGHKGYITSVAVSPDGSLCASSSKDGTAKLWDLARGEIMYELACDEPINQIAFSPNRYWLCAATEKCIRIWDLENKEIVAELLPPMPETKKKATAPQCTSIAWSADGATLYSGYTDNVVRVWSIASS